MQRTLQCLEHLRERALRAAPRPRAGGPGRQGRFRQLQIPVAEVVPGELVQGTGRIIEAVVGERALDRLDRAAEARADPAVGDRQLDGRAGRRGRALPEAHGDEARRIPQLVTEVAVTADARQVEADVAARGGDRGEGEAQRVGPMGRDAGWVLLASRALDRRRELRLHEPGGAFLQQLFERDAIDDVERIDHVALGLGHLVAVLIADEPGDVDVAERHVTHELQSHHHHARDPEEDDVEAGDQDVSWVEALERGGGVGPTERRERPQGRREPGIEHILVLAQGDARADAVLRAHLGFVAADVDVVIAVVPRRDAMPPPQLPAHAPVLDVAHPFEIGARPVLRHEAGATLLHGRDGRRGERGDLHVPLVGEIRLEHRTAAIAARHHQPVLVDALDESAGLELRQHALAGLEALESAETLRYGVGERGARREDVDQRQVVALADVVVVEIVRRCDLEAAGAEGRVDVVVGDHRHGAFRERHEHAFADEFLVARILRVYRHRGVPEYGLRARGRHHQLARAALERVAHVPQLPLLLLRLHLQVRQRREQHRIPVDQALAAVDQPFSVQPHEHLGHCARQPRVHGEALARPVDRISQAPHLGADGAAGLLLPLPHALEEGLAGKIGALHALGVQLPLDHHLRGDARVVGPGLPQGIAATHALVTGERVHERVREGMPHVQRAGHVRRRDHDAIGGAPAAGREPAVRLPALVDTPLDGLRRVHLFHLR